MNPKFMLAGLITGWCLTPAFGYEQSQGIAIARLIGCVLLVVSLFVDEYNRGSYK